MSETVRYKGKLIKLNNNNNGKDYREIAKEILCKNSSQDEVNSIISKWIDCFDDEEHMYQELLDNEVYEGYFIKNNNIYEVKKQYVDPDNNIFDAKENSNGEIEFDVKYYNGGCGFNEALDTAIKRMEYERE